MFDTQPRTKPDCEHLFFIISHLDTPDFLMPKECVCVCVKKIKKKIEIWCPLLSANHTFVALKWLMEAQVYLFLNPGGRPGQLTHLPAGGITLWLF